MKSKSQVKNQGEQLQVNRPNYLIPPYRKPTPQEQQRYEQSKQLTILPILQPTPQQLLHPQQVQKPKQVVKTKTTTKPSPKQKQGTLPLSTTTTPQKSKTDLKKQVKEMKEWLDNLQIR